jgi:RNA-binding protein YhbY
VAKSIEVHPKTLDRIVSRKTQFGRTDTIGKIAMYFRTKEKRKS